tara:strand:+ start:4275 stop:4556 length:282 start_codon:yes stop_codon:yes gene_type:complete
MDLSLNNIHNILSDSILYNQTGIYNFIINNKTYLYTAYNGLHHNIRIITQNSFMPFLHDKLDNIQYFHILRLKNELDITCYIEKNKLIINITN